MVEDSCLSGFGAYGLVVVSECVEDGEVVVEVESPGGRVVRCEECGGRARSKGRRRVVLRDALLWGMRPVRVVWRKRLWFCGDGDCGTSTWTETCGLVEPRRVLTNRAVDYAVGSLATGDASVASVANRLGVGWHTVWSSAEPVIRRRVEDPDRVAPAEAVGFDETVMSSAGRYRRRRYITASVNADTGQVIDVFEGRDAADLDKWARRQPRRWARAVRVVCCDPHEGYRKAIVGLMADDVFAEDASLAADPFHIVRLGVRALDEARRRTPNETTGHRGRKPDPLYRARKLLIAAAEKLDHRGTRLLDRALAAGDPYDEVADCWRAKEKIRSVFRAADPDQAAARLHDAIDWCNDPLAPPELARLARTLTKWRAEIITSVATRTTNARTEAANAKIKDIKRKARGYTNLNNYRLRILLATGQQPCQTNPTTRIRTHKTPP